MQWWHEVLCVQVTSQWKVSPGTWMGRRTASSLQRSWTRVKTWPTPSPTISSTPHTTHISQVHIHTHTHIEAVGECRFSFSRVGCCISIISLDWVLLLTDYMCSSSILPRMNALVANLEMQLRLHIILGFKPHRSVMEMHWSTQGAPPTPHPRIRPYLIKSCHGTEVIDIHELNISLDW